MGNWKYLPEDAHLLNQPEAVIEDLLQWKYLTAIVEKQNSKKREKERNNGE